jgi:hypothetical protein
VTTTPSNPDDVPATGPMPDPPPISSPIAGVTVFEESGSVARTCADRD